MSGRYIAIIDSGVGGISVLEECLKVLPNENFLYFGDNGNAPYGTRTDADLLCLTVKNIELIKPFGLKAVVFGCNTLSTRILSQIEKIYPDVAFFGTFPPVELNVLHRRKTLLLCTPNTAKSYCQSEYLTVLPLERLALDIERNAFDVNKVDISHHVSKGIEYLDKATKNHFCDSFYEQRILTTKDTFLTTQNLKMIFDHHLRYFQVVILGCTHYNFVKNQIFNHFQPPLITGGESIAAINLKKYLQNNKSLEKTKRKQVLFIGEFSNYNERLFLIRNDFFTKNNKTL